MTESAIKPYWASVDSTEIADNILDKVEDYYEFLQMSGRLDLYRRSWTYYYRPQVQGAMLNPVGEQGELTAMVVNNYRNFLSHLETMTTQQEATFEPQATNSDQQSQEQVILAVGLLDYYMREKRIDRYIQKATKESLIGADGFVRVEWDANGGKIYGQTPTGAPVYQGDIKCSNYSILSCIRDVTLTGPNDDDWMVLRDFQNKYTLAAKFPEIADKILEDQPDSLELTKTTLLSYEFLEKSDQIPVYTLLHKATPAMPQGRYTQILTNGTVMMDGPIPYDQMHVYRIAPDEQLGTIFGYTTGYDLLPIQEAQDILYSTVITNQSTHGVQNVLAPKGHDLSVSQIAGGMNLMEYDPKIGKPESLNLTNTPPEIFNFIQMLDKAGETTSGVNSVARGNPESSLKSGAALALIQSQAIQFSMPLQKSYANLVEDVGTGIINILKMFAATPRVAAIVGESNRPYLKSFSGNDLSMINRVTVDMGNPLTKTTSGKVNLAEMLADRNMLENSDQFLQVVTTGNLAPAIEGKQAQLNLIKGENEGLSKGQQQRALITDNHAKHILEHGVVLSSPEARQGSTSPSMQATLAHIQEHLALAQSPGYQAIAAMLGHQIMTPMVQPAPQGAGGVGNMMNATPPVMQDASNVRQPNMPNPPQGADQRSTEIIQGQQSA